MKELLAQVGGRKAAACLTGLVVVVGLYISRGPLDENVLDAIKFLVTTYLAGNIASDVVSVVTTRVESRAEVAVAQASVPERDERIDVLVQGQKSTTEALQFIVAKINAAQ